MTKLKMLEKIKELFKTVDELADYGFYNHEEIIEIKDKTFDNFNRMWDIKK